MIDEAAIIPYTNNWKQTRTNNTPQYIHTNKNGEFISGLIYHLDMVLNAVLGVMLVLCGV